MNKHEDDIITGSDLSKTFVAIGHTNWENEEKTRLFINFNQIRKIEIINDDEVRLYYVGVTTPPLYEKISLSTFKQYMLNNIKDITINSKDIKI